MSLGERATGSTSEGCTNEGQPAWRGYRRNSGLWAIEVDFLEETGLELGLQKWVPLGTGRTLWWRGLQPVQKVVRRLNLWRQSCPFA